MDFDDLPMEVEDLTKNGKCSQCGSCCVDTLPATGKELKAIKRFVRENEISPRPKSSEALDLICPFLSEEKKCKIYPVRPSVCRNFLCNKPKEVLQKERTLAHRTAEEVSLRNEIFGDDSNQFLILFMKEQLKR